MSAFAGSIHQGSMQQSLGKAVSLSTAAWFLALYADSDHWDEATREAFISAVQQHSEAFFAQLGTPQSYPTKQDPRYEAIIVYRDAYRSNSSAVKLFTDMDAFKELLPTFAFPPGIVNVSSEEEADFLFVCRHVKNFTQLPPHVRVGQFPYEGAFVRKDLLPITIRKHCYEENGKPPAWWLPCYDLSTEFHLFAHDYNARLHDPQRPNNRWIIKPAQGTQGHGHQLVISEDKAGITTAACKSPCVPLSSLPAPLPTSLATLYAPHTGDRVAQLLVERPLLIDDRKFDIRCFVFVRSFEPFVAFVPILHYARLANKPYNLESLDDYQVALTVTAYDADATIASLQERRFHLEFQTCLDRQYGVGAIDTKTMWQETLELLRGLFGTAGRREVGVWPNSSAYYAVDVIYDTTGLETHTSTDAFVPQPKLVEVNFMGDWHGVLEAVTGYPHPSNAADCTAEDIQQIHDQGYNNWICDLLSVVVSRDDQVSNEELSQNPRLVRL